MADSKCEVPEKTDAGGGPVIQGALNALAYLLLGPQNSGTIVPSVNVSQVEVILKEVFTPKKGRTNENTITELKTALDSFSPLGLGHALTWDTTNPTQLWEDVHTAYRCDDLGVKLHAKYSNLPKDYGLLNYTVQAFKNSIGTFRQQLELSNRTEARLRVLDTTGAFIKTISASRSKDEKLLAIENDLVAYATSNLGSIEGYKDALRNEEVTANQTAAEIDVCDAKVASVKRTPPPINDVNAALGGRIDGTEWTNDSIDEATALIASNLAAQIANINPEKVTSSDCAIAWAFRSVVEKNEEGSWYNGIKSWFERFQKADGLQKPKFRPNTHGNSTQVSWTVSINESNQIVPDPIGYARIAAATRSMNNTQRLALLALYASWDKSVVDANGLPNTNIGEFGTVSPEAVPLEILAIQHSDDLSQLAQLYCESPTVASADHPVLIRAANIVKNTHGTSPSKHRLPGFGGYGECGRQTAQLMKNEIKQANGTERLSKAAWAEYVMQSTCRFNQNNVETNAKELESKVLGKLDEIIQNRKVQDTDGGIGLWNQLTAHNRVAGVIRTSEMLKVAAIAECANLGHTKSSPTFDHSVQSKEKEIKDRNTVWTQDSPQITPLDLVGRICLAPERVRKELLANRDKIVEIPEDTSSGEQTEEQKNILSLWQIGTGFVDADDAYLVGGYLLLFHFLLSFLPSVIGIDLRRGWTSFGAFLVFQLHSSSSSKNFAAIEAYRVSRDHLTNVLLTNPLAVYCPSMLDQSSDVPWTDLFELKKMSPLLLLLLILEKVYYKQLGTSKTAGRVISACESVFRDLPVYMFWLFVILVTLTDNQKMDATLIDGIPQWIVLANAFVAPEAAMFALDYVLPKPTTTVAKAGTAKVEVVAQNVFRKKWLKNVTAVMHFVNIMYQLKPSFYDVESNSLSLIPYVVTAGWAFNTLSSAIDEYTERRNATDFVSQAQSLVTQIDGFGTTDLPINVRDSSIQDGIRLFFGDKIKYVYVRTNDAIPDSQDYDVAFFEADKKLQLNPRKLDEIRKKARLEGRALLGKMAELAKDTQLPPALNLSQFANFSQALGNAEPVKLGLAPEKGKEYNAYTGQSSYYTAGGYSWTINNTIGLVAGLTSMGVGIAGVYATQQAAQLAGIGLQFYGYQLFVDFAEYLLDRQFGLGKVNFDLNSLTARSKDERGRTITYTPAIQGVTNQKETLTGEGFSWTASWLFTGMGGYRNQKYLTELKTGKVYNVEEFRKNWQETVNFILPENLSTDDFLILIVAETELDKVVRSHLYVRGFNVELKTEDLEKMPGLFVIHYNENDDAAKNRFQEKFKTVKKAKIYVDSNDKYAVMQRKKLDLAVRMLRDKLA